MKNKKTHRLIRMFSKIREVWDVRPACKIDNKTWSYNKTTNWKEVDCINCLKHKDK